jgi:hypothetical protein
LFACGTPPELQFTVTVTTFWVGVPMVGGVGSGMRALAAGVVNAKL